MLKDLRPSLQFVIFGQLRYENHPLEATFEAHILLLLFLWQCFGVCSYCFARLGELMRHFLLFSFFKVIQIHERFPKLFKNRSKAFSISVLNLSGEKICCSTIVQPGVEKLLFYVVSLPHFV
jgi:hypothetical protein